MLRLAPPSPRTLVAVGLAVVLLGAIAAGGWYWYEREQRRAATAYAEVLTRAYAAQAPQAAPDARERAAQELERVIAEHPSGPSVAEAAFELGNLRYAARQYAPARAAYEIALARDAGPTVGALARTSIGYTFEAEGNFAKAVETYEALANDLGPRDFLFEQALLDLGRAQELAGRAPDAIATYQRLLKEVPGARRADEVRARLAALGAPAPAASPATAAPAGR